MSEDAQASGTAPLHLGWHGDKVCLGAGPMRMRLSEDEARSLMYGLRDMLTGQDEKDCGCQPDTGVMWERGEGGLPPELARRREDFTS